VSCSCFPMFSAALGRFGATKGNRQRLLVICVRCVEISRVLGRVRGAEERRPCLCSASAHFRMPFRRRKMGAWALRIPQPTDCVVLRSEHSVSDALVLICSFGFGCSYVSDFRRCSIENYLSSTQRRNGFESLNLSSYASCGSDVICVAVS
jgi:hypothetical protein